MAETLPKKSEGSEKVHKALLLELGVWIGGSAGFFARKSVVLSISRSGLSICHLSSRLEV